MFFQSTVLLPQQSPPLLALPGSLLFPSLRFCPECCPEAALAQCLCLPRTPLGIPLLVSPSLDFSALLLSPVLSVCFSCVSVSSGVAGEDAPRSLAGSVRRAVCGPG